MSTCCDPNAPKIYTLMVGGDIVGLIAVEQAFLDVKSLNLTKDEKIAEKLLEIVGHRNYIPEGTELEFKVALLAEYKKYLAARSR